jgi:hypothetical protein
MRQYDAAIRLRTVRRAKATGHFLAILAFAQVAFVQVVVKCCCCIVQEYMRKLKKAGDPVGSVVPHVKLSAKIILDVACVMLLE